MLTSGFLGPLISARTVEAEADLHTAQLVRQVARAIEFYVREMDSIISVVTADSDVRTFLVSPGRDTFTSERADGARHLLRTVSDAHPEIAGILLASAADSSLSNEIQPITRDPLTEENWYRAAVENLGNVQLLPRPIGRNLRNSAEYSADDVVSIVKAVVDTRTGRCRGVVLIDLRLKVLEDIFVDVAVSQGGFLFIDAPGGAIVYAPVNPVVYRVRDEWMDSGQTSMVRRIRGADYQIQFQSSDYTHWRTVGVFPLNEIMSKVGVIRYYSMIIALITLVFAFVISIFFASSIARPVTALGSLMKEAEEGNLGVRYEGTQGDEIGHLGQSFNAMIEEIQKLIDMVYREQQESGRRS